MHIIVECFYRDISTAIVRINVARIGTFYFIYPITSVLFLIFYEMVIPMAVFGLVSFFLQYNSIFIRVNCAKFVTRTQLFFRLRLVSRRSRLR